MLAAAITPTPTPLPQSVFSADGFVRAYAFQRINRSAPGQRAFNFGGGIHAEYTRTARPLTAGLTYYFADPLGTNAADPQHSAAIDNTLPGYAYRSLGELYLEYRTWRAFVQVGKMQITTPWANSADARMIPVTYQGVIATRYLARGWSAGFARIVRFKSRTSATFDANDLITQARTPGFTLADVAYRAGRVRAAFDQYWFYDVASLTYLQARYDASRRIFLAVQGVAESQSGRALLGSIHNHTLGAQIGTRGRVQATIGYDAVLGSPILSPYTDGYVADPLFTTGMVASLVDQRASGHAIRFALTAATRDGRLGATLAHGFYSYATPRGPGSAVESEADVTVLLSPIDPTRIYTGFSLRQRWGYRAGTGPPLHFLYSRTQLQYVF